MASSEKCVPVIVSVEKERHFLKGVISTKRDGKRIANPGVTKTGKRDQNKQIKSQHGMGRVEEFVLKPCPKILKMFPNRMKNLVSLIVD